MSAIKSFLLRYGFTGTLVVLASAMFVAGLILFFISPELSGQFWSYLVLPADAPTFFRQPWSLVTHIFVTPVGPFFLSALFNILGFFFLSALHRNTFGEVRNRNFIIHSVVVTGLLYVLVNTLLPWSPGVESVPMFSFRGLTFGFLLFGMIYYPNLKVNLYGIFPISMLLIGAIFLLLELISIRTFVSPMSTGILISVASGAVYSFLMKKNGTDISSWVGAVLGIFKRNEKSTLYTKSQHKGNFKVVKSPGNPDQAEIDRILDKISEVGYEKLTREEKETLAKYSEKRDSNQRPGGPGR